MLPKTRFHFPPEFRGIPFFSFSSGKVRRRVVFLLRGSRPERAGNPKRKARKTLTYHIDLKTYVVAKLLTGQLVCMCREIDVEIDTDTSRLVTLLLVTATSTASTFHPPTSVYKIQLLTNANPSIVLMQWHSLCKWLTAHVCLTLTVRVHRCTPLTEMLYNMSSRSLELERQLCKNQPDEQNTKS